MPCRLNSDNKRMRYVGGGESSSKSKAKFMFFKIPDFKNPSEATENNKQKTPAKIMEKTVLTRRPALQK